MNRPTRRWSVIDATLPWLILGVLMVFIYVMFFQTPFVGFDFNPSNGEIIEIFAQVQGKDNLVVGDHLTQVGQLSWDAYLDNPYLPLFENIQSDDEISLLVERGGQERTILWKLPGPTYLEIINRLFNIWWLGYIFWLIGTISVLFVRPRDTHWGLFISFNYLTAIWLVVGNWSRWQTWGGAVFFASVLWLCVPIYLHLHWVFPKPLRRIPRWLLWGIYSISILLAIAEWFLLLPRGTYYFGFLLATGGSIVLLILHYVFQSPFRRDVGLLFMAFSLAIIPSILFGILHIFGTIPSIGGGSLLALPIVPVAYFYAIYRRRFGNLEARANRMIAAYVFFIMMGIVVVLTIFALRLFLPLDAMMVAGLVVALVASMLTAIGYPLFTRWFEFHWLGIQFPPEQLVDLYANRITISLTEKNLSHLIQTELLPSLMVRQSALLQVENGELTPMYTHNVGNNQLPEYDDLPEWIELAYRYLHPSTNEYFPWVRLVMPLQVEGNVHGLWLLGRRDPDDYYAIKEINMLRAIASQMAVALVNIAQNRHIFALYQTNVEQAEAQRKRLARDLHDSVLNQLASISMQIDDETVPGVPEQLQTTIADIRNIIYGLRPTMLDYGLPTALDELVDELTEKAGCDIVVQIDIEPSDGRYDTMAEVHLYRIIQQAAENALKHARASAIRIHGSCTAEQVHLAVDDNGIGLLKSEQLDFNNLLANKHFGLAGMFERAELIGAELNIATSPGFGSKVSVVWQPEIG